jgi:hypothetical protein
MPNALANLKRLLDKACSACDGGRVIPLGEHFVSHEMAIDGGNPESEGASMGVEWGGCPDPDGIHQGVDALIAAAEAGGEDDAIEIVFEGCRAYAVSIEWLDGLRAALARLEEE